MRHIVLDTETTGLDPRTDRIVEIGAVELIDYAPHRTYHCYANPGIPVPIAAQEVHGLTGEFLAQFPPLDPAPLLAFIGTSPIVAHNAAFDVGFITAECGAIPNDIIDSLALARKRHPLANNTLDALCRRYGIPDKREKHGALIDAQLLAQVYVELVGRQSTMDLSVVSATAAPVSLPARQRPLPGRLTTADREAHAAMAKGIPRNLWQILGFNYHVL